MGVEDLFDIEFFLVVDEIWRGTIVDILAREFQSDMGRRTSLKTGWTVQDLGSFKWYANCPSLLRC